MQLEQVEAHSFRNLEGKIAFSNGLNIFLGENGQGKTNWLEAINVLASTRSFKTARLSEAIRFGEELAIVRGSVRQSEGITRELQATIQANSKAFLINSKRISLNEYLGELTTVVFNADELSVVRGMPESRRKFLDNGIISLHPPFVRTFTDYSKVIKQKNALLQKAADGKMPLETLKTAIAPWNEQLVALASRIHKGRTRFVDRLNEALEKKLFGREELSIRYVSSLEGKGDLSNYEELLTERLLLRLQAEVVAGHTLIGPHRDDLEILFDGHDIRKYGSAGQQRSALLLLLLANISVFFATRGEYPLILLDDIDAELDFHRIGQLLEYLKGKTQIFATTSKPAFIEEFGSNANVIEIEKGSPVNKSESAAKPTSTLS